MELFGPPFVLSSMGRQPRIHVPGQISHVMNRGNGGQPILTDEDDWPHLLSVVARVKETSDLKVYAYCLIPNHLHLLLQVGSVPLSRVMHRIATIWAKRFNMSRGRAGHVFQGRFKSLPCNDDAYFKWLLRYIHLNPVKDGLVRRPEDWPWSSYRDYLDPRAGGIGDTAWPLSLFGSERCSALDSFKSFILQDSDEEYDIPFSDSRTPRPPIERKIGGTAERPQFTAFLNEAAQQWQVDSEAILQGHRARAVCAARQSAVTHAVSSGYGVAEIARALRISVTAVSNMLRKRWAGTGLSRQVL